ncbi:MAG: hypothetical protein AB9836_08360 [Aminipila sp.]
MSSNFNITIGTSPSGGINLEKELELIKVGLIYADKVKLCSLTSSMLISILALTTLDERMKLEFLESTLDVVAKTPEERENINYFIRFYTQILKKKRLSKQELLMKIKIKNQLDETWRGLTKVLEKTATESGLIELIPAIESKKLEIDIYGNNDNYDMDSLVKQFIDSVGKAILNGETYPLFDEGTGKLINAGISEGMINFNSTSSEKSRHMGFVSNIIQRLPCFEYATIDEILDIREELSKPLIRFRAAMIKYSEQIKHHPWDTEFAYDSDKLFSKDIEPAILDIEEAIESNKYLKHIVSRVINNPLVVPATSSLGLMVSSLANFPNISATALGAVAGGGTLLYNAMEDWKEKNKEIERNQLYFYYKAGAKIKR